jgi:hypothetical protein
MANGDFSSLLGLTVNGAAYNEAIYDPTSEAACTANNTDNSTYASGHPAVCRYQYGYGPGTGAGPQGNPVLIGTPNVIPANKINAVAQAIMSWYPAPNQSPTPTTANPFNNNYVGLAPAISDNKSYIVKLDQTSGKTTLRRDREAVEVLRPEQQRISSKQRQCRASRFERSGGYRSL